MAVVTARRVVRPDRVSKQKVVKTSAKSGFPVVSTNTSSSIMPLESLLLQPSISFSEQVPINAPSFTVQSDVISGGEPQGAEQFSKKRKTSKSKASTELRRTASTPQIRGLTMSEPGLSPTVDKRRNKLGYHRTSVACGHCRRRKIRCLLPTPEDSQGRCANCIRLKKECNFYPVTESAQQDRPTKKSGGSGAPSSSTPSPPRPAGSSNQGSVEDLQGTLPLRGQPAQYNATAAGEGYNVPQTNGVHFHQPHYGGYSSLYQDPWSNSSDYPVHRSQQPGQQEALSPYWSSAHTPVTTSYQTSPPASADAVSTAPLGSPSFPYQQNAAGWTQPRSLSFGHVENASGQYQYHQNAESDPSSRALPYPSQVSSITLPSLSTSGPHASTHASTTQPMPSYSYPQHWQTYHHTVPSSHDANHAEPYANHWYGDAQPARGEEHQPPETAYGTPPVYYPPISHPG